MSENRALLSQDEIDALVSFLTTKEKVGNEVLDQTSIDRLVKVLTEVSADDESAKAENTGRFLANSVLSVEKDIAVQRAQCALLYEKDGEGFAHVICVNHVTGVKYEITPECINQSGLVEGTGEGWGRAVMPLLFDLVALQLQVKYTAEVFSEVCDDFAKVLYGTANINLPNVYLPTASRVLENIGKK